MKERASVRKALSVLLAAILATLFMIPGTAFATEHQEKVNYDATEGYAFPDGQQTRVEAYTDGYTITKDIPVVQEAEPSTYIVPLMFDGNGGKIDGKDTKTGANLHSVQSTFAKWEDPDGNTWFPNDTLPAPDPGNDFSLTATYAPADKVTPDKFPGKDITIREGYVLLGWTDADEKALWVPGEDVPEIATVTEGEDYAMFYAVWAEAVDVTFVNGVTGETIAVETIAKGDDAKAPTVPEMEGYVFVEWDKPFTEVTEDLTVTAVYKPVEVFYKAIFDSNGADGTNDPAFLIFEKSAELTLPKCTLTRDGYEFTGWSLTKDGTGDVYAAETKLSGLDKSVDDEGTVIFYAQWKKVVPEKAVPKTGFDAAGNALAAIAGALALAALGYVALRRTK